MANFTRKTFEWLAREIAPMTSDPEAFIIKVREFNTNRNFCPYKFRHAVDEAVTAKKAVNDCGPDLYKLDDHIPY